MKQKIYNYIGRQGFNYDGNKHLEKDYVKITTYDYVTAYGRIQAIYHWAVGGRQGIVLDIIDDDGELLSFDDVEIRDMEWLG